MQERFDFGDEFLREIFELRTKAGLHALAGPDQLFAEGGERRALAAMGLDQRHTEEFGPLLDQIPDMPIGKWACFAALVSFPVFRISLRTPSITTAVCGLPSL